MTPLPLKHLETTGKCWATHMAFSQPTTDPAAACLCRTFQLPPPGGWKEVGLEVRIQCIEDLLRGQKAPC